MVKEEQRTVNRIYQLYTCHVLERTIPEINEGKTYLRLIKRTASIFQRHISFQKWSVSAAWILRNW